VVVDGFRLSKSQRRCLARNQEVRCSLHRPDTSSDQITLFNRYHDAMHALKGWPHRVTDIDEYTRSFLAGQFDFAHEMRFWHEDRLVGVGLVDITPWGMSSVYFYHDPDWRPEAPGVYSMLRELLFARDQAIPHHYLGYWISACASMAYKSNYGPHELLQAYVEMDQEPSWALPEAG
jgi:arginine-tRNA-protein transferase